ncbi:hypothetical protein ADUPG1_013734 [Aduncisulcus paluster]|uniref:Uncharacterized protein n=1 Tax=Aduncisulcus paluster TaxID=2918883 RepID=A0ABQ5K3Z4_9EUKA|nr:hypothetical protein ADUPG1_013734 [Aduncisulcus paluster]
MKFDAVHYLKFNEDLKKKGTTTIGDVTVSGDTHELIYTYKLIGCYECPKNTSGYYGKAFVFKGFEGMRTFREGTGYTTENCHDGHIIVFAHEGTQKFKDLIDDFYLAKKELPPKAIMALGFVLFITQFFRDKVGCIEHTGHSLGATLAEIMTAASVDDWIVNRPSETFVDLVKYFRQGDSHDIPITALTFETPGSRPIISDKHGKEVLVEVDKRVHSFNSGENIVNTCMEKVGRVHKMVGLDGGVLPNHFISEISCYIKSGGSIEIDATKGYDDLARNSLIERAKIAIKAVTGRVFKKVKETVASWLIFSRL